MANPDWPVKTLGDVCEFQNGHAFRSAEYVKNGHALIRIKNVQQGEIVLSDDVFVQIPKDGTLDQFVLNAGDILMSLTGYLGRVGRLDEMDLPAALNQRVAKVSVKSKALLFDGFLYRVLDSQWFRDQIEVYGRGAAQQNVGTSDISKIEIPVPPLEEQKLIVLRLDSMRAKTSEMIAAYDAKLQAAKDLRQSVLEAAFAGEL
jgi:type I restriction enzyme S subunit